MSTSTREDIIAEGAAWRLNKLVDELQATGSILETCAPTPQGMDQAEQAAWRLTHWGTPDSDTELRIDDSGLDYGAVQISYNNQQLDKRGIIGMLEKCFNGIAFLTY